MDISQKNLHSIIALIGDFSDIPNLSSNLSKCISGWFCWTILLFCFFFFCFFCPTCQWKNQNQSVSGWTSVIFVCSWMCVSVMFLSLSILNRLSLIQSSHKNVNHQNEASNFSSSTVTYFPEIFLPSKNVDRSNEGKY